MRLPGRRRLDWLDEEGPEEEEEEPEKPEPVLEWMVRVYMDAAGKYQHYYSWTFETEEGAREFMEQFKYPADYFEIGNFILFPHAIVSIELTSREKR